LDKPVVHVKRGPILDRVEERYADVIIDVREPVVAALSSQRDTQPNPFRRR